MFSNQSWYVIWDATGDVLHYNNLIKYVEDILTLGRIEILLYMYVWGSYVLSDHELDLYIVCMIQNHDGGGSCFSWKPSCRGCNSTLNIISLTTWTEPAFRELDCSVFILPRGNFIQCFFHVLSLICIHFIAEIWALTSWQARFLAH